MSTNRIPYPFTAIEGQKQMKAGLILNLIDPNVGGVLVFGEKGTAKSTAVRAIAELLPEIAVVEGCRFRCDPDDPRRLCSECRARIAAGETLKKVFVPMKVVDLPVSATEDRVVGTMDMEEAIAEGKKRFEPGILAEANRGILYVDEVNLLEDHIVDLLLDAAAMGVNTVEREGISVSHPARFVLVGTMNPEEGELRPQLLDRFGLSVRIEGIRDPEARVRIMKLRHEYDEDPEAFRKKYEEEENALARRIEAAKERLANVSADDAILRKIAQLSIALEVDGHRADLTLLRASMARAAFHGREKVLEEDLVEVADMVYRHRMRTLPFEQVREFDHTQIGKILAEAEA